LQLNRCRGYDSCRKMGKLSIFAASEIVTRLMIPTMLVLLAGVVPCAVAADPDAQFVAAANHYQQGQWQVAADGFAALVAADPSFARAADAHFFCGEALVQLQKWEDARPHFDAALKADPTGQHARQCQFRSGEAAFMLGDDQTALPQMAAFVRDHPTDELNSFALVYLGDLELLGGRPAAAEQHYQRALANYPNGPMAAETHFGLAQCHHQARRLPQARDAYRQAVGLGSDVAEPALVQLGLVENSLGNFAAAQQASEQLLANYPQSEFRDRAQLGRGYALYKQGQHSEAIASFTELRAQPGVEIDAAYLLGLAQSATGDWPAAAETLKGIQLDDSHALAAAVAYHSGDALLRTGKLDEAAAAFDRVVQQHGASAWADDSLMGKARVAIEQKDAATSLELADALLAKFPDSPLAQQARLAKGQALAALEKPEEAIAALEPLLNDTAAGQQATELRDRAQSIVALGQARLGEFDEARKAVEELAQDPAASQLANELKLRVGEMAQAAGKSDVANDLLAGVSESSSQLADRAKQGLGWNYFEAGRWEEAAAAFDEVLKSGVTGSAAAEASLLKARALEHLQKADDALAMYQEVAEKYADTPRAAEALHRAAHLLEGQGAADQATSLYAQLLEKFPDYAALDEVLFREAWLSRDKDPKFASQLLERVRAEYATSRVAPEATLQLSELLVEEGQLDRAAELLREVTRPDAPAEVRPRALYLEGQLELARQNLDGALRPLEQLLREHPESAEALAAEYLRGEVAFRKGDYRQAVTLLSQVSEKTQGRADAWLPTAELRRAQALAQSKQWLEAAEAARSIAVRFPDFAEQYEADYLVGRAAAAQAEFDEARKWYAKAISAPAAAGTETAAMAQWMTGESYFHQQQYAAALDEYLRVGPEHARWHAAALLQAGKAQEALGRWQDAAAAYGELSQLYPDSPLAAEASQRLTAARTRASAAPNPSSTQQ